MLLIDASGYLYRSYFAIRNMTNLQGQSTNALFGFIRSCQKLFKDFPPEKVVCIFDGPQNAKGRKEIYADYKAHRSEMPQDLRYQIDWARHWCDLAGFSSLSVPEVEADDTMGSIAEWAAGQNIKTYLCTTDKDLCQMVQDHIFLLNTFKDNFITGPNEVESLYGVKPSQMIDYLSIMGDTSDNIPGLPGIGPKGATKLLQEFGSLDEILAHPEKISSKKTREIVEKEGQKALLSRQLVKINLAVPFPKRALILRRKTAQNRRFKRFL